MASMVQECPTQSEFDATAALELLNAETLLSVNLAVSRFAHAVAPPDNSSIYISYDAPTLFASTSTFRAHYNLWLSLPTPSAPQLAALRDALAEATRKSPSLQFSIAIVSGSRTLHAPIWVLNMWPRLRTLIQHSKAWLKATDSLEKNARSGGTRAQLALELISCLATLPLDSAVPGFPHLRTSDLPNLLCDEWLSDEHINAGGEFINAHPHRKPNIRVLNSFFISTLHLAFERSATWSPRHPILIDSLVSSGAVNQLLIPINLPSHWAFIFIDISLRTYSYVDTLAPAQISVPSSCIDPVDRWLSAIIGSSITLTASPWAVPVDLQRDSHSCGVAVLSTMASYAILSSQFPGWTQATTAEHRLRWGIQFSFPSFSLSLPVGPFALDVNLEDLAEDKFDPTVPFNDFETTSDPIDSGNAPFHSTPRFPVCTARLTQSLLPFKPISHEEWRMQESKRLEVHRIEREAAQDGKQLLAVRDTFTRRERERLRKQAQRNRQRDARSTAGLKLSYIHQHLSPVNPEVTLLSSQATSITLEARQRISASTRPFHSSSTNLSASRRSSPTQRVNWCAPLIWSQIESATKSVGFPWSPIEIIRRLQQLDPHTFSLLRPQRISQWRDHRYPDELRWTESHMRAVKAGNRPFSGIKHQGVLAQHPRVTDTIKARLCDLRTAGVPLDMATIRGYMVGVLQHEAPELFTQVGNNGKGFRCSERFTRRFLREHLGWSIRKATRAAQKYPSNLNTVLLHAFLRFACVVRDESVPACCIVNADQTQVVYTAGSQSTWSATGERQVHVLGLEEKRAFTLLVAASLCGEILPFQAIYSGKTDRSLPDAVSPGFLETKQLGIRLEYSGGPSYWSNFSTMCCFVSGILAPYFTTQKIKHKLPPTQRCIFQIDCWSVHRSDRFRTWMHEHYPWIVILYVPGGCTGLFQACDVGLQRILKLAIRRAAHSDVVNETLTALQSGASPQNILNDQGRATLRNRSVNWILQGYHAINRPEIVKKAFKLCEVPETSFNLSFESLTSHDARQAILQLRTTNPQVYAEITSGSTQVLLPISEDPQGEELNDISEGIIYTEDDPEQTIDELHAHILQAESAHEAAAPLDAALDNEDDLVIGVSTAPFSRSSRALRRSARLAGSQHRAS